MRFPRSPHATGTAMIPLLPPPLPNQPATQQTPLRRIALSDLMAGAELVILLHDGQEYRLRLTRANKLILTK